MVRHTLIWVVLSAVIALMFVRLPQIAARQDAVFHTYGALVEVDALAKQRFVEPFEDDRLVEGAIRGMMLQLDPYSGYIAPREVEAFERRTHGDFIGVGMEIGMAEDSPAVIAPIEGSPAARAGVKPGDIILSVNGVETKGLSVFDVEERLGGKPGTAVTIRVRRAGQDAPLVLSMVRGPVTLGTVRGFRRKSDGKWDYLVDPEARIGYLRISGFCDGTMRDFDAALEEMAPQELHGLILDLRYNPGGVMPQAVAMVDRFVTDGLILSTVNRRRVVQDYFAAPEETLAELPLVVLINRFSASSAEIVAGSLQDHGRAVVIGERTFGKGSVQHLIHLTGQRAAVKLTVGYYRLPGGRVIHRTAQNAHLDNWGVMPDVAIGLTEDQERALLASRRLLDMPPDAALEVSASPGSADSESSDDLTLAEPFLDRQLDTALTLLQSR